MPMEEELHVLKFTKKEKPENLALKIAEILLSYKIKLPDSNKAAHTIRRGKVHYADVLCAAERACRQH